VLPESGVSINLSPKNMHTSLRVALMQSGFHYETADLANLSKHKIVFAVARHGVSSEEAERQGLFKLIEHLCSAAGAGRTLRLKGDLQQALHVAVTQFTDETREIRYVVARTSGEVPWS
jgi:hypothetical protein